MTGYDNSLRSILTHNAGRRVRSLIAVAVLAGMFCSTLHAVPDNGHLPPPGPGDGTADPGPGLPPGPCAPPRLPPDTLYRIEGTLTEQCGGSASSIDDQPIEALVRIRAQTFVDCVPPNSPPHTYTRDAVIATGRTDANGNFQMTYQIGAIYDLIADIEITTLQAVRIQVLDAAEDNIIGLSRFSSADITRTHRINETFDDCLTNSTRIRVVDTSGDGVFGSELFINGSRYGDTTDSTGFIYVTPMLSAGDTLVARARVHESKSKRGSHSQGSDQNWKYRAYITSMPLEHDANGNNAAFNPASVVDPNDTYTLELSRDNTMIGLHLVLSAEWDASPSEMATMFDQGAGRASEYIFNATDGQFFIERIDVFDDKVQWNRADFKVYADLSMRAHVDWPGDGFWRSHDASLWRSSWMHMSRSNDSPVYIHEFGHYGFKLGDEYVGGECAAGVASSTGSFSSGQSKASCVMFSQWDYTKFCSDHGDNRHQTGTKQGDEDCWSEIKRHFENAATGPDGTPRWRLKTPVTRNAIVGRVPSIPVTDWRPVVALNNSNDEDLCQPVFLQWTGGNGAPIAGARVFTRNKNGRIVFHGVTDEMGQIDPFQGSNRTVTGLHIGDEFGAMFLGYAGGGWQYRFRSRTFTEDDCTSNLIVFSTVPGEESPEDEPLIVAVAEQPFTPRAHLVPTTNVGEALIHVTSDVPFAAAPTVLLSVADEASPREIAMTFDSSSGDWIGSAVGLPDEANAIIEVQAIDEAGQRAFAITQASMSGAIPDEESHVVSADSVMEVELPAGAFSTPTPITISESPAPLPNDIGGRVVSGPYVIISGGEPLSAAAMLRFRLPFEGETALFDAVDMTKLAVLTYDNVAQQWTTLSATFDRDALTIESEIDSLGSYVLLETESILENGVSLPEGLNDASQNQPGDGSADSGLPIGSADCGTGACGAGTTLMVPLSLVLLGTRRRRSGSRA